MIILVLFLLIPFVVYTIKERKNDYVKLLNFLLIANLVVFLSPITIAFVGSLPDGNMWSENGSGVFLWFYIILIPVCSIAQIIWFILVFLHWLKNRKQVKN